MATSIKITALTDIGNSITPTSLVPVVNMVGTPTTEKANLQIVITHMKRKGVRETIRFSNWFTQ